MPWAYPPGGSAIIGNGPMMLASHYGISSQTIAIGSVSYTAAIWSELHSRVYVVGGNAVIGFIDAPIAGARCLTVTNFPASTSIRSIAPVWNTGGLIVFGNNVIFTNADGDGSVPWVTAVTPGAFSFGGVFTARDEPGNIFVTHQNNGGFNVRQSVDGGLNWTGVNFDLGISQNIQSIMMSRDGTHVVLAGNTNVAITAQPSTGTIGAEIIPLGAVTGVVQALGISTDNQRIVWASSVGDIWTATRGDAAFVQIPIASNPFRMGNGSSGGLLIAAIMYVDEMEGFILLSDSNGGVIGFISDDNLTICKQGINAGTFNHSPAGWAANIGASDGIDAIAFGNATQAFRTANFV